VCELAGWPVNTTTRNLVPGLTRPSLVSLGRVL